MTYATGNIFGPTQPNLDALVKSYKSKHLREWKQKAPYGSMLACCSDKFYPVILRHFNLGKPA